MAPAKKPRATRIATSHIRSDKFEYSPTGHARCRGCGAKMRKDDQIAEIKTYHSCYDDDYTYDYYHRECVPQSIKPRWDRSPDDEFGHQNNEKVELEHNVQERADLREALRQLRLDFARRLAVPPYVVFHDTVLDQLTAHMPKNRSEFLAIHGMGPKKYESYGECILQVIHDHRRLYKTSEWPRRGKKRSKHGPASDNDDHEEELAAVKTLSCEEIVRRKFEDAKSKGYFIKI